MLNKHTMQYPYEKSDLTQVIVYDANNLPEYIGYAVPGVAKTAPGWQIRKLTYDENNLVTDIQFAGGTNGYDHIFDDGDANVYSAYEYS